MRSPSPISPSPHSAENCHQFLFFHPFPQFVFVFIFAEHYQCPAHSSLVFGLLVFTNLWKPGEIGQKHNQQLAQNRPKSATHVMQKLHQDPTNRCRVICWKPFPNWKWQSLNSWLNTSSFHVSILLLSYPISLLKFIFPENLALSLILWKEEKRTILCVTLHKTDLIKKISWSIGGISFSKKSEIHRTSQFHCKKRLIPGRWQDQV